MAQIIHITTPHNSGLGDPLATAMENQNAMNTELYSSKVDKIEGKVLSDTNFSQAEKDKLALLNTLTQPQVQADMAETNPTALSYVKNKTSVSAIRPLTDRFVGDGQDYAIAPNRYAFQAYINDSIQHLFAVGMELDLNTFTQVGEVITFKETIEAGNRITIYSTL